MTLPLPPLPPLGNRLTAGGRQLWIHRSGKGGPAVVILAGGGAIGLDYLQVHEGAVRRTTSVLYDRAGTGWSEPAELPRSAGDVIAELRALLAAADVPPPYLLVGHSLGGAYARHYAQRFPEEVAGMVLIDPLHEDSSKYWPPELKQGQEQLQAMATAELPAGMLEAYRVVFEQKLASLPAEVREALVARHLAGWRTGILESLGMEMVCDELRKGGPVPGVPITLISAMGIDPVQAGFTPVEIQQKVNDGKHTLHELIRQSVRRGRHVVVPDASHAWVVMERPDVVVEAIEEML